LNENYTRCSLTSVQNGKANENPKPQTKKAMAVSHERSILGFIAITPLITQCQMTNCKYEREKTYYSLIVHLNQFACTQIGDNSTNGFCNPEACILFYYIKLTCCAIPNRTKVK